MTRQVPHQQDARRRHRPPLLDTTLAACRTADPAVFYHPEGERGPARRNRDNAAKAICGGCPIIADCRQEALANRESWGVWGGLTEDEREKIWAAQARRLPDWIERELAAS